MLRVIIISIIAIATLTFQSCKHQEAVSGSVKHTESTKGGNGSSFEQAVFILDSTETTGVDAEYVWLRVNYPGYKLIQQSLVFHEGKPYDVMEIKTSSGRKTKVYFDISNYFGKF